MGVAELEEEKPAWKSGSFRHEGTEVRATSREGSFSSLLEILAPPKECTTHTTMKINDGFKTETILPWAY